MLQGRKLQKNALAQNGLLSMMMMFTADSGSHRTLCAGSERLSLKHEMLFYCFTNAANLYCFVIILLFYGFLCFVVFCCYSCFVYFYFCQY
jgi:hypothetical protein